MVSEQDGLTWDTSKATGRGIFDVPRLKTMAEVKIAEVKIKAFNRQLKAATKQLETPQRIRVIKRNGMPSTRLGEKKSA